MIIYCDLDGVLVDFYGRASEIMFSKGLDYHDTYENNPKLFWKTIADHKDFWYNLDWLPDGMQLWKHIKSHKPHILTGIPHSDKNATPGKEYWIKKNLGIQNKKRVHIVLSKDKQNYADENSILIDDSERNIKQWIRAGGIGILHFTTEKTIKKLNDYI